MSKDNQPPAVRPDPPAPPAEVRLQVRVLRDCDIGVTDAVVELPEAEAATRAAAGQVDPHPDAVAYALSLQAQVAAPAQQPGE